MATIDDVAREACVSKATVSRVLNGTAPVNNETKKKIELAMEVLKYSPSFLAQSMRSKKTKTIGVIVPDYANPFYSSLFKEIEKSLRAKGYMALICPTDEDAETEIENVKKLVSRQIDGIIFFTYKGGDEHYKFITELSYKTPCVFMDQVNDDLSVSQVITNGFTGVREATRYLLEKGHRRIACIKGPAKFKVTSARYQGYLAALEEFKIHEDDRLIYEGDFHIEGGFKAGEHFSRLDTIPSAVVSVTDLMAIGALRYFGYAGIRVPEQVEVIGFDNISLCTLVTPPLSTVAQPIHKLAEEAVNLLVKKIDNPRSKNRKIVLEGELIIRRSTDHSKPEFCAFSSQKQI